MKSLLNDKRNVLCVKCAVLWVVDVVSTDVGVLDGVAGRLDIDGDGSGVVLRFPAVAQADDCVDKALLRYAVEEANKVVVDRCEVDVFGCGLEMVVEVLPKVGYR